MHTRGRKDFLIEIAEESFFREWLKNIIDCQKIKKLNIDYHRHMKRFS